MKATNIKWMVFSTVLALAGSLAQASDNTSGKQQSQTSPQATSQNEVRLSKLMDAKATTQSGDSLGKIQDLLINPTSGKIDFVVLGRGGFLGIGEKKVPVPWQAINLQSEKEFTVNVDKNKLQSAPTLRQDYSDLANPDYAVTIYRFYEIPMGASESPSGGQQGQGAGPQSTPDVNQGQSDQSSPHQH